MPTQLIEQCREFIPVRLKTIRTFQNDCSTNLWPKRMKELGIQMEKILKAFFISSDLIMYHASSMTERRASTVNNADR